MVGMLSRIATRYVALTVNSDPYASKAFVKPTATLQTIKVLISFMQVVGSLAKINIEWPTSLQNTFTFFSTLNLDLMHFPSTACMFKETSFLSRLFMYGLGPIGFILVMLLPWLWAKSRDYKDDVIYSVFKTFMTSMFFIIFLVYPPVSRTVISALNCDNLGHEGRYLHVDFNVNCDHASYIPVQVSGAVFICLWPVGAILFLLGLLHWYNVPRVAQRKLAKAQQRVFMRHIIANASKQKIALSSSIHEDCLPEDLDEGDLRVLVCAANSTAIGYKPVLKLQDR